MASTPRTRSAQRGRPPHGLRLDRLADEFLYECQQTLSPATCRSYGGPIGLFLAALRQTLDREPLLEDFTSERVLEWTASLKQRLKLLRGGQAQGDAPLSIESVRTYLRTLRVFANWLADPARSYCAESPLRHFKLPRPADSPKLPITPETLERLLAAADADTVCAARARALLLTLLDGALRAKEIAGLTLGDVPLQEGILVVRRGKGNKARIVAVGEQTSRALRRYAVVRDSRPGAVTSPEAPFFQTMRGTVFTYDGLKTWMQRLARAAGVPHVHLHLLRHTSAFQMLDAGADVRTVQLKLGHASITTTQRYLNMTARQIGERQRAFSPVDRLGLTKPKQPPTKRHEQPAWPMWQRKERER